MKAFLLKIIVFSVLFSVTITLLLTSTNMLAFRGFDFGLPEGVNTLVVGDSHPTCAIDDSILAHTLNLSNHGTGYYFSYLKVKNYLEKSIEVDTIVLGYSFQDIMQDRDDWFGGMEKISKVKEHLFLMDFQDYAELAFAKPTNIIPYTPKAIYHNIKLIMTGNYALGGFEKLKREKLEEHQKLYQENVSKRTVNEYKTSEYQLMYLRKIYDLCLEKKVTLILLNTPIHPDLLNGDSGYIEEYCEIYTKILPEAIMVDHSSMELPEHFFADLGHLNYKGAAYYSSFINKNGFSQRVTSCN